MRNDAERGGMDVVGAKKSRRRGHKTRRGKKDADKASPAETKEGAPHLVPWPWNLAERVRAFAQDLNVVADQLDDIPDTWEGVLEMRHDLDEMLNISRCIRSFSGLVHERHERLYLIAMIDRYLALTTAVMFDEVHHPDVLGIPSLLDWPFDSTREAAVRVRALYAEFYPDRALRIDLDLLERALVAWQNPRGRPRAEAPIIPKFEAIVDLLHPLELLDLRDRGRRPVLTSAERAQAAGVIEREWLDCHTEVTFGIPTYRRRSKATARKKRQEIVDAHLDRILAAYAAADNDVERVVVVIVTTDFTTVDLVRPSVDIVERGFVYVGCIEKPRALHHLHSMDRRGVNALIGPWDDRHIRVICHGFNGCNVFLVPCPTE